MWIENELHFSHKLLFDHSTNCVNFLQSIYSKLETALPDNIELVFDDADDSIEYVSPEFDIPRPESPAPVPKRIHAPSPSPTRSRQSPAKKKPFPTSSFKVPLNLGPNDIERASTSPIPTTKPFNQQRVPFKEVNRAENKNPRLALESPKKLKSPTKAFVTPVKYPKLQSVSPSRSAARAARQSSALSSEQSSRSSTVSPVVHAQAVAAVPSSASAAATTRSMHYPGKQLTMKKPESPLRAQPAMPSLIPAANPKTLPFSPVNPDQTVPTVNQFRSAVSINSLLQASPRCVLKVAANQTFVDFSTDDESGTMVSWARTPQLVQRMGTQQYINPVTVFEKISTADPDKVIEQTSSKPILRRNSSAWGEDALSKSEQEKYAKESGYK